MVRHRLGGGVVVLGRVAGCASAQAPPEIANESTPSRMAPLRRDHRLVFP